jgi:hypothetical protein
VQQRAATINAPTGSSPTQGSVFVVDLAFGVAGRAVATVGVVGRGFLTVAGPLTHVLLRPSVLPAQLQPGVWFSRATRRGAGYRSEAQEELAHILDVIVPVLVSQLASRLDLTKLVQENVDMAALVQEVLAEVDLPEIIRESTGVVASDTLLGVRMQSISGDEAIGRALHRLRRRLAGHGATSGAPVGTS